ncbi:hypothetical protein [Psychromicrobium xiongbiense]|uniref:hypothetical protein n=1 Tax=Psychromicrobium xiongbiense TaxID=3051184 RepID=UPI002556C303|nr:hypothetical protein [Psychromicrobium sp. YIM S02556]
MKRLLVPSSALFWGLQFTFLNPVLALLLMVATVLPLAVVALVVVALVAVFNVLTSLAMMAQRRSAPQTAAKKGSAEDDHTPVPKSAVALVVTGFIALQVLNAWFFGVVAGMGPTLFQQIIPRPGLASGLFTNTRRLGAIISGPVIGLGSASAAGYQGIFPFCCAGLAVLALLTIELARRASGRRAS